MSSVMEQDKVLCADEVMCRAQIALKAAGRSCIINERNENFMYGVSQKHFNTHFFTYLTFLVALGPAGEIVLLLKETVHLRKYVFFN